MKKLLLIEDSTLVLKVMNHLISEQGLFEVDFAADLAQARNLLSANRDDYFAAVVDLNLPDSPNGEAVDEVLASKIPVLVLTASIDTKKRDALFEKGIVDYVIKENRYSYEYAVRLMVRLFKNNLIKVLVVDDSLVARKQAVKLLQRYRFVVEEADGAKSAIKKLVEQPDIKLVVTDYNMPEVDGFDLVRLVRSKYDKSDLIIIGLSGEGNAELSAKFIKNGANDFLRKPFNQEEFYCRIIHNIEAIEAVKQLKQVTAFDSHTGLVKKEGFIEKVESLLNREGAPTENAMAIIAIDDFNDFYSLKYDFGNQLILPTVTRIKDALDPPLIGRLSDKHIAVFLENIKKDDALRLFDEFASEYADMPLPVAAGELELTLSVGLVCRKHENVIGMLEEADKLLQKATDAGHNNIEYL